jgi:hypothetical protein
LKPNVNAFANEQGQWNARYVPISDRRHPFILAESEGDQLSLAVYLAAPHWVQEGEALFGDQGEHSELVRNLIPLLVDFQSQVKLTSEMTLKLSDPGLLKQQNLQVNLDDGREAAVNGVWMVDEVKLRELTEDKVLASLKKSGWASSMRTCFLCAT